MRILHLCLAAFYIDGYSYQENNLPRINKEDGHDVMILASTETYVDNTQSGYLEPSEYVTEYGVPIKRLPYVTVGNHTTTVKFRKYPHLYEEIAAFAPDVILSHNHQYWSLLEVIRYKKDHPEMKLYVDTHTAYHNSGTNWISLHILHRIFYKYLIQKAIPYIEKYFYITEYERQFAALHYNIPDSLMEFYPLGGNIFPEDTYQEKRNRRRAELKLAEDELLFVHAGKLDKYKCTAELLQAFSAVPNLKAKLVIIGSIPDDMAPVLEPLMTADERVAFLGWKTGEELQEYLCACDLYCQPGTQSATMQNSVCCGCGVLSYPHKEYKKDYDYGNILWVDSEASITEAFKKIATGEISLISLAKNSARCARELLDYRSLAARLYR